MQLPWRSLSQPPFARVTPPVRRPVVTVLLTAAVAAGWTAQWAVRGGSQGGADPLLDAGALTLAGLRAGQWWRLGTQFFVTADPWWLAAAGLVTLALAGRTLERNVRRRHLWRIFALAGVLGGLGQVGFSTLLGDDVRMAGVTAAAMGWLLALSCVSPWKPLLPWGRVHGVWRRVRVIHGTLGALVTAVLAGTIPPAAGALAGALTGCLYVRTLEFCRRGRDEDAAVDGTVTTTPAPTVSAASSASWPPGMHGPAVGSQVESAGSSHDAPSVLTAPATAAAAAARSAVDGSRFTARERRMSAREFIAERVDPVLEKISREGLDSLTPEERQLLEKAREKMGAK